MRYVGWFCVVCGGVGDRSFLRFWFLGRLFWFGALVLRLLGFVVALVGCFVFVCGLVWLV